MTTTTTRRGGLISDLLTGNDLINFRPVRIGIAGVRFQSGGGGKGGDQGGAGAGDGKGNGTGAGDTLAGGNGDQKTGDDGKGKGAGTDDGKGGDGDKGGAGDKGGDGSKGTGKADGDGQSKAPDKYELTVSDDAKHGAIGDLVGDIQADVEADAKASGWTNEEAQAELDERLVRAADRRTTLSTRWRDETSKDTEFGGAKLDETTQLARNAVNKVFPEGHRLRDSFLRLLNGSGIGNKLEVVAFLATVGRHFAEDSGAGGRGESQKDERKSDAAVLFPSSAPKA